jgi:hypothetical protein
LSDFGQSKGGYMTALILSVMLLGQVLPVDSIMDAGGWTDPVNIFVSDDLYATTGAQNDNMVLRIADPTDTTGMLDSVYVYLEQYVSATNGFWSVIPIINGTPGTQTAEVAGTPSDSMLGFNISGDIAGWADLFDFQIDLIVTKGGGATPDWFADYLHVYLFVGGAGTDGQEEAADSKFTLTVPSFAGNQLNFSYGLTAAGPISIEIYNVSGARVLRKELRGQSGANNAMLDIGNLGHGMYFIKASAPSGIETAKFIILN